MASYTQSQSNYPYFCQSGPGSVLDTNIKTIATSITFWNSGNGNLERGYSCITTNTSSGLVFTAPVKGLYYFKIIFNCINNSAVGDNSGDWGLTITKGGVATNRYITDDPGNISTQNTEYNTQFSTIAFLNVSDTVKMYVSGWGADQETYLPNSSFFMGYLVSGFN